MSDEGDDEKWDSKHEEIEGEEGHFKTYNCGVQFYKGLTNLRCLLATVFIHTSIYPSAASVQASLVTS
ncbi:hypothetical protein Pcinc_009935 [Petrolisthes cinctipes]|uniref:Uncharacterized protein n=1 Tax=Petrolisthes cinctipes TaxID=88211 RepID=A0AAE1GA12_PETCI|nr:hypothetical protein Pcinc_009935 [Petrolisthes cinctipes]